MYLVRAANGSLRGWIALKDGRLDEVMRDLVRVAIGSWSPLDLDATWVYLEIISGYCWYTPLEVSTLCLPWSPLEVGVG